MIEKLLSIQHRYNPLHVHCRLMEKGFSKDASISLCRYYEVLVYSWLAWFSVAGIQICRFIKSAN